MLRQYYREFRPLNKTSRLYRRSVRPRGTPPGFTPASKGLREAPQGVAFLNNDLDGPLFRSACDRGERLVQAEPGPPRLIRSAGLLLPRRERPG